MLRSAHIDILIVALAVVACDDAARTVAQRIEAIPPPSIDARYFARAELAGAIKALRQRLGDPINSLRLEVHPDRVVLQAQDPVHPTRVEQYEYRGGTVSEPITVNLTGPGALEPNLFPLRDLPIDAVDSMVARAVARVDAEHGNPVRLVARRGLPETPQVRIRLFVESPGFDGYADFDKDGKTLQCEARSGAPCNESP